MRNLIIILYGIMFVTSCGQPNLNPIKEIRQSPAFLTSELTVEICNQEPERDADLLGVLFIIDITGSNQDGNGRVGNDPTRENRYGNLINWINKRKDSPKHVPDAESYAILEFNRTAQITNGGSFTETAGESYFRPLTEFGTIVETQRGASTDTNGTPYIQTFGEAQRIVKHDLALLQKEAAENADVPGYEAKTKEYVIIFLSDGVPCTNEDGGGAQCPQFGPHKETDIDSSVESLVEDLFLDAVVGPFLTNITLNTAFYNLNNNTAAEQRLERLAKLGNGDFHNFNNGSDIDYDQIVVVKTRKVDNEWADFFIENKDATWSREANYILADWDQDGVPDADEYPAYCIVTDDCDNDGIRDVFEHMSNDFDPITGLGKVCDNPNCEPSQEIELCQSVSEVDENGNPKWLDFDGDGLRTCEEKLIKSNDKEFDSNFDGIPDPVAIKHRYFMGNVSSGQKPEPLRNDQDNDKVTDINEIKQLRPWHVNNKFFPKLKPVEYIPLEDDYRHPETKMYCDLYKIDNFPVTRPDSSDTVKVTIVDKEKNGRSRDFIRFAEKKLENGSGTIKYEDFKIGEKVQK